MKLTQLLSATLLISLTANLSKADIVSFQLAQELLAERQPTLAAVEYRRSAAEAQDERKQAVAYLSAGHAYLMANQPGLAMEMLERSDTRDQNDAFAAETLIMQVEAATRLENPAVASYYAELLLDSPEPNVSFFARRRLAALHLNARDLDAARLALTPDDQDAINALDQYAKGSDKRPAIGGLLGLIPGAGYWYSGEIANGLRSLILNSLFIYGMVHTAQEEQWGAFAVITFFEFTWYTGSIYGGIDAAHRYNRNRLHQALHAIDIPYSSFEPELDFAIPLFQFKYQF